MSSHFSLQAQRCLDASEGWVQLGDWKSAYEELAQIEPPYDDYPEVLRLRTEIQSVLERWEGVIESAERLAQVDPGDSYAFFRKAYALHELKRTQEAWNTLIGVAERFSDEWVIPYNLACYTAQLGDLPAAREWLAKAFKLGDAKALRKEAKKDPDLAPLWETGGV